MKYINKIGVVLLGGMVLAAASCADYSDYNTAPVDELAGANKTLWENISEDPQLTKFVALAQKCKYDKVLSSANFYTVWAPTDGYISNDEYTRLLNSDSAVIVKQFMQQHITDYNHPVSANLDSMTIISLNQKHHPFTQATFDGFTYSAVNQPSTNGLMHKINGYSPYRTNLYENIDSLAGCDSIKKYLQQYDEWYLDPRASVLGKIINGEQTYDDSVMKKRNTVITRIMRADLEQEDSTYCMLVPNNKAWEDAYKKIAPCYAYIKKMDYMDLSKKTATADQLKATDAKADKASETTGEVYQDSLTCYNLVNNLVFSHSYQRNYPLFNEAAANADDSLYSTSRRYLQDADQILDHTVSYEEMSNGIARVIDSLTFRPNQTYNPIITSSMPAKTLKVNKLTSVNIPLENLADRDTLFSEVPAMFKELLFPKTSRFFSYVGVDSADVQGTTGKPEFNFALPGVRSTTYHIYVVTVPEQVRRPEAAVKPYYLRFYLSYTDADNKQQYIVLPQGAKANSKITTADAANTATVVNLGNPGRVHVIDLGEFTFPACYYSLDAYPSLMMMHTESYTSAARRKSYDQQMRVAGVYLIPKEYNDKWANSDNEE